MGLAIFFVPTNWTYFSHRKSIIDEKAAIAGNFGKHYVPRRYDMSQRADRKKALSSVHPPSLSVYDEVENMDVLRGMDVIQPMK